MFRFQRKSCACSGNCSRNSGFTYIFISHSLPVVAQVASRIAVMRAGQFVESGSAERILREPRSPYTRELLAAVPEIPRPAKA